MRRTVWTASIALLLGVACSTTHLAQTWKSPDYSGGKLHRVLVVGMTSDPATKGIFEDDMAHLLAQRGVQVVTGHQVIPTGGKPTHEQLEQAVKGGSYDAVLVSRPAGVEERTEYVPGTPDPAYGGFYDYYMGFFPMAYDPGYFTTTRTYKVVTNVYGADAEKLIWSATSETIDPSNRSSATKSVVKKVTKRLQKDGLL